RIENPRVRGSNPRLGTTPNLKKINAFRLAAKVISRRFMSRCVATDFQAISMGANRYPQIHAT
ncbi:hypothetical protein, partial [Rhizobium sp. 21-4511-3d]